MMNEAIPESENGVRRAIGKFKPLNRNMSDALDLMQFTAMTFISLWSIVLMWNAFCYQLWTYLKWKLEQFT